MMRLLLVSYSDIILTCSLQLRIVPNSCLLIRARVLLFPKSMKLITPHKADLHIFQVR
jgi:hypothetical protein